MDKFRSDLKIIRSVQNGEETFIVKDPVALKYFRFGLMEISIFKNLDGTKDHDEVARLVSQETGLHFVGQHISSYVENLRKMNFIEQSASEKSLILLEHLREDRKFKASATSEGKDILYQRFPLYDPDDLYNRVIKYIRFLWSREFFIFCMILFSLAAMIIISNWDTVSEGLTNLRSFESVRDVGIFLGVLFIVIIFHENGHGLTCKYYGGEVHEVGFMLIFFMPAFYANVSDAWTFQSKASKLWVTFAGAFVELIMSSIAAFIWYFSTPGYLTHQVAFTFMLVAGLSSIIVNMNPLIKLDGYFALVDYLEISNLSGDSSKYISALARKYILRSQVAIPEYTPRLKRIYFIYGFLSVCYRVFMLTIVLLFFYKVIGKMFPESGLFVFLFIAYRLLRKKLRTLWNGIRHFYVDKKELLMKPKSLVIVSVAAAAVLGILLFLPFPHWYRTTFVIEPAERIPVRAESGGFISSIAVGEGAKVRRGQLLAVLRDPDVVQKRDALKSRIAVIERRIMSEQAQNATAESIENQRRRDHLRTELAEVESTLESLNLTSPVDGVIVTSKLDDRLGAMLKPGDRFCEIATNGSPRVIVAVDDWDLLDVSPGSAASLRLNSSPDKEITGHVASLAPASELHQRLSPAFNKDNSTGGLTGTVKAAEARSPAARKKLSARQQAELAAMEATSPFDAPITRFDAMIEVDADPASIKPGMTGEVKIYGRKRTIAMMFWTGLRDWFRTQIWW